MRKRVILVPSKWVLSNLAFAFPRTCIKLFTSIPPQWSPAANVPERKLFRCFQCFCHALCFTWEISLTTQRSQNTTYSICVLEKRSCPNFMHTIASRKAITLWVNESKGGRVIKNTKDLTHVHNSDPRLSTLNKHYPLASTHLPDTTINWNSLKNVFFFLYFFQHKQHTKSDRLAVHCSMGLQGTRQCVPIAENLCLCLPLCFSSHQI